MEDTPLFFRESPKKTASVLIHKEKSWKKRWKDSSRVSLKKDKTFAHPQQNAILTRRSVFFLLLAVIFLGGCLGGGGKTPTLDPDSNVEDSGLKKATKKLIAGMKNREILNQRQGEPCVICFLGVQNLQGEELPPLSRAVRRQFAELTDYEFVDNSEINAAIEESGIKKNDVLIPSEREKFAAKMKTPFQYYLSGQVASTVGQESQPGELAGDTIVFSLISADDEEKEILQERLASVYTSKPRKKGLF